MLFTHLGLSYMCEGGSIIILNGVYVNIYNSLIRTIRRGAARRSGEWNRYTLTSSLCRRDLFEQGVARTQKDLRVTIYCEERDKRQTGGRHV